jgi:ligand-binding sensor domain-containing protein/two-component sensor histidine kinase
MVYAAHSSAIVEKISINDGLSQNFIYDIIQDKFGFLWIATKDGLNRYDGINFKIFNYSKKNKQVLSSNYITSVLEDEEGNLWVGTKGKGLNFYDRKKNKFFQYPISPKDSLGEITISELYKEKGNILIGTNNNGLFRFNTKTNEFSSIQLTPSAEALNGINSISKIKGNGKGKIWIATYGAGLFAFDYILNSINYFSLLRDDRFKRINRINDFIINDSIIWLATREGLVKLNLQTNERQLFQPVKSINDSPRVKSIIQKKDDLIVIGESSIWHFDIKSKNFREVYFNPDETFTSTSIIDKTDIVWIGTSGWGVIKYDLKKQAFNREEGNFLKFVFPKLIDLLDNEFEINLETDRAAFFNSIIKDTHGNYWAAVRNQTIVKANSDYKIEKVLKPKLFKNSYSHELFGNLYEDRNRNIWFSTFGGICKINPSDYSIKYFQIYPPQEKIDYYINSTSYPDITCIYQDKEGIFWLGTPTLGLSKFNETTNQIEFFNKIDSTETSFNSLFILSIEPDPKEPEKYLWIGTDGNSLMKFDKKNETFVSFEFQDKIPGNVVYGILSDHQNNLWMSSNNGLIRFNPSIKSIFTFDENDGLQSKEFNRNEYYKTDDGKFVFGGVNGYNWFYPENVIKNNVAPKISLTGFKIYNKNVEFEQNETIINYPIELVKEINLKHNQNMLTFKVAVLDFSTPAKNRYSYMLEGLDSHWNISNINQDAIYTNLDPGKYTFLVKGANNHGVWNSSSLSIAINISPAWWQTWWFKGLSLLLFLSLTVVLIKYYTSIKYKEKMREIEKKRALENERLRISRNMHDELGARLAKLSILLRLSRRISQKSPESEENYVKLIEAAKDVESSMDEIIWSVDPKYDNLDELINFFTNYARSYFEETNIKLRFDFPFEIPPHPLSVEERHQLFNILKESLTNVLKHSSASEVELSLKENENVFIISIRDNGIGFEDYKVGENSFGLNNMKARAESIGFKIRINSTPAIGTEITLEIPK